MTQAGRRPGSLAYLGVGSNIGDALAHCRNAAARIGAIREIRLLRIAPYYRTEPVGFAAQEWFVNTVWEIRTRLSPQDLLFVLKGVEKAMGRNEKDMRWGPRIIDLDILLVGQEVIRDGGLVVPHPELHRRRFVLEPLCALAPYVIHPSFGVSARGLLERLEDPSRVRRLSPLP